MTADTRILAAVTCGDRVIIPLVRDTQVSSGQGIVVIVNPVALLISDAGKWMVTPLEEGISPAIFGSFKNDPGIIN
jgi:predicted DNA repair protein MutK